MVHNTLLKISENEKMRDLADLRAASLFDQYFREKNARDEGSGAGYSEGYEAGKSETLNMVAGRMIQGGMEESVIAGMIGLDRKKIDEIAKEIGAVIAWER